MKLGMSTPVGTGRVAARMERKNLLQVAFVKIRHKPLTAMRPT